MDYLFHLLILVALHGILAISLNYVAGFTGIISLSHATFVGIGAYATAILTTKAGVPFFVTLLAGMIGAAVVAWIVSLPLLRLKEDAFILVSFGFTIIAHDVMLNWTDLTDGPLGIKGVPPPSLGGVSFFEKPLFLVLSLLFLLGAYFLLSRITRSPYGTILKSIRENETVASVNGHRVSDYQRSVFAGGAALAAMGGSLWASYITFIEPNAFDLFPSVLLLIMVILGGLGNLKGSILGAAIMMLVPELLRFIGLPHTILAESQQIIYGLTLVLLMFLRPQGILGDYRI